MITEFAYSSTLYLPPLLTLNAPFPLYFATLLTLVNLCLLEGSLPLSCPKFLLSLTKVDKTHYTILNIKN